MIDCHLKAIEVVNNLKNVDVRNTYTDDHLLCCDARVTLKDGRDCMIPFMWLGWEGVAALQYFDSSRARGELINIFTQRIDMTLEDLADFQDGVLNELEERDVAMRREVATFFNITEEDLE